MNPRAPLQALLDREAIRECLYRYCRGIDRVDEEALRSAYWEDATDCHGAWNGSADGFIAQALQRLRQGGRRVHQVNNIAIELHGDVAAVESGFFALQAPADAPAKRTLLCGRYLDRFERRYGIATRFSTTGAARGMQHDALLRLARRCGIAKVHLQHMQQELAQFIDASGQFQCLG
ncbi:MAG: nuclear transport factor 2 family protein, partial [Variovorax sp.]